MEEVSLDLVASIPTLKRRFRSRRTGSHNSQLKHSPQIRRMINEECIWVLVAHRGP